MRVVIIVHCCSKKSETSVNLAQSSKTLALKKKCLEKATKSESKQAWLLHLFGTLNNRTY